MCSPAEVSTLRRRRWRSGLSRRSPTPRRLAQRSADPPKICRDPEDDYLLALAIASKADALVTGDDDLHAVPNPGVEIITPRELLDCLGD